MKMKLVRIMRNVTTVSLVSLLGACAGVGGNGYLTKTMHDDDFIKASAEEKNTYLSSVVDEEMQLRRKKDTEYSAGRPVKYGEPDTGYTIQWNKKLGHVYTFLGHSSGALHAETEGVMAYVADANGNILYQDAGNGFMRPTALLENVSTQEGLGRMLIRGGFQVTSAAANGLIAAKIHADNDCGDNCENITLVNQGGVSSSQSTADSNASGSASASVLGACPSGNCVAPPMD